MKAEFNVEQKDIVIKQLDNKDYIYICLNGEKKDKYDEFTKKHDVVYEYDYKEIIEDSGVLNLEDVRINPEKYLNYNRKNLRDVLKEQDDKIQLLTDCLLEMSMQVYQ